MHAWERAPTAAKFSTHRALGNSALVEVGICSDVSDSILQPAERNHVNLVVIAVACFEVDLTRVKGVTIADYDMVVATDRTSWVGDFKTRCAGRVRLLPSRADEVVIAEGIGNLLEQIDTVTLIIRLPTVDLEECSPKVFLRGAGLREKLGAEWLKLYKVKLPGPGIRCRDEKIGPIFIAKEEFGHNPTRYESRDKKLMKNRWVSLEKCVNPA